MAPASCKPGGLLLVLLLFVSAVDASARSPAMEGASKPPSLQSPSRAATLRVRAASSAVLITSFAATVAMGRQSGCAALVGLLQCACFHEGTAIAARDPAKEAAVAGTRRRRFLPNIQWHVFGVFALFAYGKLLCAEAAGLALVQHSSALRLFLRWHLPACAALYVSAFVRFLLSLRDAQLYGYQLGQFAAAHFAAFVVLASTLVTFAMRAGLFWFLVPASLVITNDILAYLCGITAGRTPLTRLSTKKTWEGFLGAAIGTVAAAWLYAGRWQCWAWLTTPGNVFLRSAPALAVPEGLFRPTTVLRLLGGVRGSPAQVHAIGLALLASLVAPFGGFFASAVKRAAGVKDFGDTIPGHGGAADRFDCQLVMLPLVYFYVKGALPDLPV